MEDEQVDVVVIGMGPGGEEVAGRLAEAGLSVVGVEAELVGGECPYWGCIPSKMMVRAAHLLAEARRIPGMAGAATVGPDWAPVAARIRDEATDTWDDTVAVDRFEGRGGRLVRGRGRLAGPGRVVVTGADGDDRTFAVTRAVVLATGTAPSIPPIDGLAGTPFWTNRGAVAATEVPARLVVLGGGAIGAELAQVFARFGSSVTVVEPAERILRAEEPEASVAVTAAFEADGITVATGVGVERVGHDQAAGFTVTLADGRALAADRLLVATGRRADLGAVGADTVGVEVDGRWVPTDEHQRVAGGVWAVGDLTGGGFTHMAMDQAGVAVADILAREHRPVTRRAVPRVTFTDPEVGSVGQGEAAARDAGITVAVGTAEVPTTARGWLHGPGNGGVIKLVADTERDVLVGATSVGPAGGEVLGLLTLAVHAEVPLATLRSMTYAYPTFHRGVEDALRDLGR